MLRFLRRTRAPALLALLVVTGSVPLSISALIHDADDAICQPALVQHDESAHRIGAARTLARIPQHCAVCHWLQSLQTIVTSSLDAAPSTDVAHVSISELPTAVTHTVVDIPARAPPHA